LVAASDVLVGVERPVIVAPVIVPPVIVAVDVNAPEIVAALIIGAVRVLDANVCAAPVPTMSPVTLCALDATSCARDSVKSLADTPCSTRAPTACDLAPELSMLRVIW
jgi:hypothetical protein